MKKSYLNRGLLAITMLALFATATAQAKPESGRSSKTRESVKVIYGVEENGGTSTINYKDGEQNFRAKMKDDKITELYVDDKKIAPENYNQYQEAVAKILVKLKHEKEVAEQDRQQAMIAKQQAEKNIQESRLVKEQAEQMEVQAQKSKMQAEQNAQQAQQYKLDAEKNQQKATIDKERAETNQQLAMIDKEKAEINAKHAEEDRQTLDNLLDDLVKENVVSDKKSVNSVELNNDTFTVNGKRQSDALHDKFKALYLRKKGTKINFTSRNFSIGNE